MLDLKFIRSNPEAVREGLRLKRVDAPLDELLELDERRRKNLFAVEQLKAERNENSKAVAECKKTGQDASGLIERTRVIGQEIKALDEELAQIEARIQEILLAIPNIPHPSVPEGDSSDD
ncbi:MAG: serine--tRNA ligase, partial [Firmicutes bacterium]|nr:serine--tRNA ligase [Bacillota bacterium]